MLYSFTAKNDSGKTVSGKREAGDKPSLARELRSEGLSLISADPVSGKINFLAINNFFVRVTLHEKVIFTRNLSAMIRAGIPLSRALSILERQTTNFRLKKIIGSLLEDINSGLSLSDGMKKFSKVFSTLFSSMVKAGEESGGLPESLRIIGLQLEKSYAMGKKVRGAMMYPSIVLSAIFVIGALMLIYVVPSLTATFKEMNAELPGSTQFVISISNFLINHTFGSFFSVAVLVAGVFFVSRTRRGGRVIQYGILRMPIFGGIVKEVNAARTARTLSSLLSAGVDVRQSLFITGDVLQNVFFKEVLREAEKMVEKGFPVSGVFKGKTDLYPVMVGEMMEVGEETGKLSEMLENIADFYESEVDNATKDLSSLIEPILMIVIGAAVGFFAVSMITPAYSILNSI